MGEKKPFFYGWIVAISCFILLAFGMGTIQIFGIFMPAIIQTTGASVSEITLVASIGALAAFLSNYFLVGPFIQKLGIKKSMLILGLGLPLQLFFFSIATQVWLLYVAGAVAGIGIGFVIAPSSIILTRWFIEKRNSVIGVVFSGMCFGYIVLMPLSGRFIANFGWQAAALYLAIIVAVIHLVIGALFIKEGPEQKGLKPYGADKANKDEEVFGVGLQKARKSPSYWLLFLGIVCVGFTVPGFNTFAASYWGSQGMSAIATSTYMGLFGLIGGFGILLSGFLAQKFGTKAFVAYTVIAFIIGILVALRSIQPGMVVLSVILIGLANPLYYNTASYTTIDAFGNKDYASLIGPFQGAGLLGAAAAYQLCALLIDMTHNFVASFSMFCIVGVVGLILIFCGLKVAPMKKANSEDSNKISA